MAEGENAAGGGPWWAQLIKSVGPTAAIAIFLVYFLAIQLQPVMQNMNTFMVSHAEQMNALIKDERDDAAQRARQWAVIGQMQEAERRNNESSLALEQQTCINTAKSEYQSTKCIDMRNAGEAANK